MRGKEIRLERIMDRNTKRTIIVPMDHGVSNGPIEGLIDLGHAVDQVAEGGANAVLGHVGLALHGHRKTGRDVGLILHLSASTAIGPDPNDKVVVNTVTNALRTWRAPRAASRRLAGRLDADPAARQESVSDAGAHAAAQVAGSRARALAGAQTFQGEILELYLNRVYFGSGAYGVEAAAQRYFGKSARNVTLAEAAMLAGLVKSPSRLAPNRNPEGAEKRAQVVLAAMADAKFITQAQARASIGHPSYNVKAAGAGTINYVADWIGEVLDDLVGQIDQNIVVETTIDPKLQSGRRSRCHRRTRGQERQIQCQPGRAGGDDAGRRGARHGRRPQLCGEPVSTARSPPSASRARRSSRSSISPRSRPG